jgi:hypothetical protein
MKSVSFRRTKKGQRKERGNEPRLRKKSRSSKLEEINVVEKQARADIPVSPSAIEPI